MGTWLTAAEAAERFGATRIAQATGGDDSQVERAVARAESRVKSELVALRYKPEELPTTAAATSEALKRIVGSFFWHYLHEASEIRGQDVRDVYDDARAELKAVGTGHMSLLLAGDPAIDNARPEILMEPVAGTSSGSLRPTLDNCWDGYE